MSNKNNGNRYSDDFRKMIVDLNQSGQSVKDLSSEYGISDATIYKWIKKYTPIEMDDGSSITQEDYAQLQKQMRCMQEENAILKKAMAIFAKK